MNDLDWKQPALFGGLIVGIASAIPGVSALNCCFCGWALIGGAIAAKMTIENSDRVVKPGDGAQIGLFAGFVAAIAFIFVSVPIILSGVATTLSIRILERLFANVSNPEMQNALSQAMQQAIEQGPLQRLLSSVPVIFLQIIFQGLFTVLGGILGVRLFEKRGDDSVE